MEYAMNNAMKKILRIYGAENKDELFRDYDFKEDMRDSMQLAFCTTCGKEHESCIEADGKLSCDSEACNGTANSLQSIVLGI
jgi:hypothetical protein